MVNNLFLEDWGAVLKFEKNYVAYDYLVLFIITYGATQIWLEKGCQSYSCKYLEVWDWSPNNANRELGIFHCFPPSVLWWVGSGWQEGQGESWKL